MLCKRLCKRRFGDERECGRILTSLFLALVLFLVFFLRGQALAAIGSVETPGNALWVRVSGSYAYVADDTAGLQIIDVSNPRNPQWVAWIETPGNAKSVYVSGSFAYVADYFGGLQVIDTNLKSIVASLRFSGPAEDVYVAGQYAYVANGYQGLRVINIAAPSAPTLVSRSGTTHYSTGVFVLGTYAYVTEGTGGFRIVDISNPAVPAEVSSIAVPGYTKSVYVSGSYAYVTDDSQGLQIIDVTDPKSPRIVSSVTLYGAGQAVWGSGPLIFVATDISGLSVIDVKDPAHPVLIDAVATYGNAKGIEVNGYIAYVAVDQHGLTLIDIRKYLSRIVGSLDTPGTALDIQVSGSYAFLADGLSGLEIINISNPMAPFLASSVATPGSANGLHIAGSYAFVTDDTGGLQIINIDDPVSPYIAASLNIPGTAKGIFVSGSCAYVVGGEDGGLQIIDVSEPEAPSIVGAVDTPGSAEGVFVLESHAFIADGSSGGLQIVDVGSPANPAIIGWLSTDGETLSIKVAGSYGYVADGDNGVTLVNLADVELPLVESSVLTDGKARGLFVTDSYVYAAGSYGIDILDFSDPADPAVINSVITPGTANKVTVAGGYAYVASGAGGLQVIDVSMYPCGIDPPVKPSAITYVPGQSSGELVVSWPTAERAQSYSLECASNPLFTRSAPVYNGPSTSFHVTGLATGTYYLRVQARNNCGLSAWETGSGTIIESYPSIPASISYAPNDCDGVFVVAWAASSGAESYTLERSSDPSFNGVVTVYSGPLTSFQETGLATGAYYYRVKASNKLGSSKWRSGGRTTVLSPPPAPTSITYPTVSCTGSLAVTWPAVSGAVNYTLQRATSATFTDATQVYLGASTAFTDSGIPDGVYYYRVQANNSCAGGAWTNGPSANVRSVPAAPAALSYPSANCGSTFTITWSSVAGSSEYTLQRATNVSFSGAATVYSGALTSFVQPVLGNGTYYYRVRSGNACGNSSWTDGAAIIVNSLPATPATITYPLNLCGSTLTVSWTTASRAETYILEKAADSSFSGAVEIYNGPATSFTDTGLLTGSYYYRVKAVNGCGSGNWLSGSAVSVSNLPAPPQAITYPGNTCSGTFTVTWTPVTEATGYTLQRATNASFTNATTVYTGSASSANQTGLADGTYYFRVKAGNGCGDSSWTEGAAVIVSSLPAAPATVTYPSTNCGTSFTVAWTAVSGATSYILQRATDGNFTDAEDVFSDTSTSFSQSVLPAATYYYRVRSSNGCGLSNWQQGAALVVASVPSSPSTITYPPTNCSGAFTVSWTAVNGATVYTLQRATSASFANATTVYTGSASSANQTGLADGTYYFRVKAGNGCGDSSWTEGAAVIVSSLPAAPATVTYPSTNCGDNFTVAWTAVSGATSYILQRATDGNFTDAADVFTGSSTSFGQAVLPAATYYYRVRSSNGCGLSNWQRGAALVVTSVPSSPNTISYPSTNCSGAFTVSWTAVNGASTYTLQRATDSAFASAIAVYDGSGTSFAQTGLVAGAYYYRVKTNNDCGSSSWTVGTLVTVTATLSPPASISYPASTCTAAFRVSWDAVSTATSYTLQRATSSSFAEAKDLYTGPATFFDENGLGLGTYYYRVLATNTCGSSSWQAGSTIMVTTTPGAPASISYPSSNCGGSFAVSWAEVSGASIYTLQRATNMAFTDAKQIHSSTELLFNETNLPAGTYYYRVLASNDCGSSGWMTGAAVAVTAVPPAPASINFSSVSCNGTLTVNWPSVSGASTYTLQRAASSNFADAKTVYSGASNSFEQTDLASGTYYFQVRAGNDCGTSDWKAGPAVAVISFPPAPISITYPTGVCGASFMVSWAAAQDATNYTLQRATDANFTTAVTVYKGPSFHYNETVPGFGTFYYRVQASNSCGISGWEAGSALMATPSSGAPVSITYPNVSCSGNFTVNWATVNGATNYKLQRSMDESFVNYLSVYSGPATSYNESGLGLGTFYYRVQATNGCGTGEWKAGGVINIAPSPPPSLPATITYPASNVGGSFTVAWSSVIGAANYTLQRATGSSFANAVEVYHGTAASYPENGLANGTYYYRVRANSDCGNSGWRTGDAIVVGSNQPPDISGPVNGPAIGKTGVSYKFTFTGQATDLDGDALQYRFSWGDGKTSGWATSLSRTHQWSVSNTYDVKVQARDSLKALSGWSDSAAITVTYPPDLAGPPSGPTSGKVKTSYTFTGKATDRDGDPVQYRFSWGDGKTSTWGTSMPSGSEASRTHQWTMPNIYCVKVQAKDNKGVASRWSECASIEITK